MMLTPRLRRIVNFLLFKVPILAEDTLARMWPDQPWDHERRHRSLQFLCDGLGLLETRTTVVARSCEVECWVRWFPNQPAPNFGVLAAELRQRWRDLPREPVTFYFASARARNHFGAEIPTPLRSVTKIGHDIGLGATFMQFALSLPRLIPAWVCEDVVAGGRGYGEKVVDAVLIDGDSRPRLAIEFAGSSYAASNGKRLRDIHDDCVRRSMPFEIWTVKGGRHD